MVTWSLWAPEEGEYVDTVYATRARENSECYQDNEGENQVYFEAHQELWADASSHHRLGLYNIFKSEKKESEFMQYPYWYLMHEETAYMMLKKDQQPC